MKKMMAVYDADTRYAERLSDYVNRKERGVFTAQAFTSKEKLAEYAAKHEIDVLLSGERTDSGDISEIPSGQKIYMSEETERQMESGKEIYKFQSGDDIIREVMAVYRKRGSVQTDHRRLFAGRKMRKDLSGAGDRSDPGKRGKGAVCDAGYFYRFYRSVK